MFHPEPLYKGGLAGGVQEKADDCASKPGPRYGNLALPYLAITAAGECVRAYRHMGHKCGPMHQGVHPQGTRQPGKLHEFLRRAWRRLHAGGGDHQSDRVACASGVMLSNVQFFLKVIDDNTISREFPGVEGMDVKYYRCQI